MTIDATTPKINLTNETCGLDQQFEFQLATSLRQPCYVAAEVEGSLVNDDGLTLTLGDDSIIGSYHNVPLVPSSSYTVAVVIVFHPTVSRVW